MSEANMKQRKLPVLAGLWILSMAITGCGGDASELPRFRAEFTTIQEEFNLSLIHI